MKRKIMLFGAIPAVVLIALIAFLFWGKNRTHNENVIRMGSSNISVELARTSAEQARGLGARSTLGTYSGMLFIFNDPTIPGFWMKDMNFPIDIVWISENRIIGVIENADPQIGAAESELKVYTPPSSVDSVIELHAGAFKASQARVGDEVDTSRFLNSSN